MQGLKLARIFGFEIRIDFSWFIILFLILWSFAVVVFPARVPGLPRLTYFALGLVGALLFFASLLAHELSHSLVARSKGIEVEGITLFMFGGVARIRSEASSPGDEFQIAGIGPLTSVLIAVLLWGLAIAADHLGAGDAVVAVLDYVALLNLILAIFNLLPGFPLDGGRVFRAIVWRVTGSLQKATRVATTGGRWLGYGLVALGILQAFAGFVVGGLWLVFIGWYLRNAAAMSYHQYVLRDLLADVQAAQTMTPSPQTVSVDLPIDRLFDEHFLKSRYMAFPVVDDGRPLGIITLDQLREIPREKWSSLTTREVMVPVDDALLVAPDTSMLNVMDRLQRSPARRVLVLEHGRLVGIITARDVAYWLEKARRLG